MAKKAPTTTLRRSARLANNAPTILRRSARIAAQKQRHQQGAVAAVTTKPRITKRARHPSKKTHRKILDRQVTTDQSGSRLLSLPAEIREQIWTEALTALDETLRFSPAARRFNVAAIGSGLLTACHLTAIETQLLPPKLNTLVFSSAHQFLAWSKRNSRLEAALSCVVKLKGVKIQR